MFTELIFKLNVSTNLELPGDVHKQSFTRQVVYKNFTIFRRKYFSWSR